MGFISSNFKNQEGYADQTTGCVIAQIIKEGKKYRPLVYICSPFYNEPEGNTEKAKRYSRFAVYKEVIPFAPHLLLPLYMKEGSKRGLALFMDMVFLSKCEELYGCSGIRFPAACRQRLTKQLEKNMKIRYFTEACE